MKDTDVGVVGRVSFELVSDSTTTWKGGDCGNFTRSSLLFFLGGRRAKSNQSSEESPETRFVSPFTTMKRKTRLSKMASLHILPIPLLLSLLPSFLALETNNHSLWQIHMLNTLERSDMDIKRTSFFLMETTNDLIRTLPPFNLNIFKCLDSPKKGNFLPFFDHKKYSFFSL